jgi:hypothetical protein
MSDKKPTQSTPGETAAEITSIALNAVPIVGGVLSGIADSIIGMRRSRRLGAFLDELAADLTAVTGRIDEEFVRSEDFENLAETIFVKASESSQKEKLDALRAVFLNTALSDPPNYDEALEIADLISRWQPRHLIILKILDNPRAADQEMGRVVGDGGGIGTSIGQILGKLLPEWDKDQIDRTWQELYDAGMHRTPGTNTMMTDRGIGQLENRLSDFGRKTVGYLRNPVNRED